MTTLIINQEHETQLRVGRKLTIIGDCIVKTDIDGTVSSTSQTGTVIYRYLAPVKFYLTALGDVTVTEAVDTANPNDLSLDLSPTLGGDLASGGKAINMADALISRPELKDFSQTNTAPASESNATTLDISGGNSFDLQLTENTTLTISNPSPTGKFCQINIDLEQTGAGTFTVTWPASVLWPGGTAPIITTGLGAIDKVTLTTNDAGTTWYGSFIQDLQ